MTDPRSYPSVGFTGDTKYLNPNDWMVNFTWLYRNFCKQYMHWDGVTRVWKAPYGFKNIMAYYKMTESSYNTMAMNSKIKSVVELENKDTVKITIDKVDPIFGHKYSITCGMDQEILFYDGFYSPRIILKHHKEFKEGLSKVVIPYGYYSQNKFIEVESIENIGKHTLYSLEMVADRPIAVGPFIARPYKKASPRELIY
jgi:hypothetical protein